MSQAVSDPLQAGREALKRYAWREAFDLLQEAERTGTLAPEDLEGKAEAAWWTGRLGACIDARERAYRLYLDTGKGRRAGFVAIALARDYFSKNERSVAFAWVSRAERLLEQEPECVEKAWFIRTKAVIVFESQRDLETALSHARETLDMATRLGDRDLMALALHDQGRILFAMGRVGEGQSLMDEATVAAVAGELTPWVTGAIYCNTITACQELADYRRAGEWTEAAKRWCERQAIAGFPGMCRVYRAEIMRLRGAWSEAEQEARRACEELLEFNLGYAAAAFYEIGEIRLRMGDLAAAEEAFRHAHELGREPQPGLALLRLAEGKTAAALSLVRSALDETRDRLHRRKLLPALVEIAIAAGDLEPAQTAANELSDIARSFGTAALEASAAYCHGAVLLARGNAAEARRNLRHGVRLWQEVDAPYETARARLLLAEAHRGEGNVEDAALELEAAKAVFDRLGALPEARRTAEMLSKEGVAHAHRRAAEQATRTLMFTDIVKSTALVEAIGDAAWVDLVRWHDETLRRLVARQGGEEVDHAGDGFFVAFKSGTDAIECAVAIQRELAEHRRIHGFAPQVRIGVHATTATAEAGKYKGKGVHEAARIGARAEGGEIVVSQDTLTALKTRFPTTNPRTVTLKGISKPIDIVSIQWQ